MSAAVLDFEKLDEVARTRRDEFASAKPFPHIVIDDFLPRETADRVVAEFDETDAGWDCYYHYNERKMALTHTSAMRDHTQVMVSALQSRRFIAFIEQLTGLERLVSDPDLDGAGLHRVLPGGFLHVHSDFLAHSTRRNWSRQINLLIYLNRDWNPEWNGAIEFWDTEVSSCVRSIEPAFNRCVMFRTDETSFHGHPRKLACPPGTDRKSLALYYFREENEPINLSPTRYLALPTDRATKRLLIRMDRHLLRAYSFLKRYTGLSDGTVSRILKRF